MIELRVSIPDADAFVADLTSRLESIGPQIRIGVQEATFLTRGRMVTASPRRTGFLANSHVAEVSGLRGTIRVLANYAIFVHEGTRYVRARPWARDAFLASRGDVRSAIQSRIQSALRGAS